MQKWATISDDDKYRYDLGRSWGTGDKQVVWVMLNPSVADADQDDLTLTKCIGFSKRWGYDACILVNLCAYRSTDPMNLRKVPDPFGPLNEQWLDFRIGDADLLVFGWGATIETVEPNARLATLATDIAKKNDVKPMCLGKTKTGHPRHPSRLGYDTPLEVW